MSMLYRNEIVQKDIEEIICRQYILFKKLNHQTVFVTGATGMLAYYFTCTLMHLNLKKDYDIRVLALVRNKEKAEIAFQDFINDPRFQLVFCDVCEEIKLDEEVHYIFHAAGAASPYHIKNNPLGIIRANILGTINILELAKHNPIKNVLFTSTREVYGKVEGKCWIEELDMGIVNPLDARSCYPESKRMAEQIFKSYQVTYQIPYNTARIAHSFGPGMILEHDGRVMADFMSNAVNGTDIVLKSNGEAVRAFCYITDAIAAMFLILLEGKVGEAYNVANEKEPYMIRDVAEMLIAISRKDIKLVYDLNTDQSSYCSYKRIGLCTEKLEGLGWSPEVKLRDGLSRTYMSFCG